MNKTPSVFLRNPSNLHEMTRVVNPLCQWVLDGEGVATRKYDGTCVALLEGPTAGVYSWWARREVKKDKTPPPNWLPVETDDITGKRMGWEPIEQSGYHKMLLEAVEEYEHGHQTNADSGTYELCGPKINGNPEKYPMHWLVKHSDAQILTQEVYDPPYGYDEIKDLVLFYKRFYFEGIVWHHPDGRMAKMKVRDYGLEGDYVEVDQ